MKKKLGLFAAGLLALSALIPTGRTVTEASALKPIDTGSNVVVYFSPHADDEALTFSVLILNDMRAGKKVYLVLMSDGDWSAARDVVNGEYDAESTSGAAGTKVYCKWHGRYHDPVAEKYLDGHLTRYEFGQARIREFYKSAEALGIPKERVKIHLLKNGYFSYDGVRSILRIHARLFPNAEFKTMSQLDGHIDHAIVGKVLNDMYRDGEIKRKQTNIISIFTDRFLPWHPKYVLRALPGYKMYLTNSADKTKVINALNVYKTWDPQHGYYGLGYHSVPEQFDSMAANTYTKISNY